MVMNKTSINHAAKCLYSVQSDAQTPLRCHSAFQL